MSHKTPDAIWRHPVASSEPIVQLKSTFQAHASFFSPSEATHPAESISSLQSHLTSLFPRNKRATHCMYAWRCSTGPSESTIEVNSDKARKNSVISIGSSDGNESGAGERLVRLLELTKCENVIVMVFRWYGGVKIGSNRWKCISGTAKEALTKGGFMGQSEEESPKSQKEVGSGRRRKKK